MLSGNWMIIDIETTGTEADASTLVAIGLLNDEQEKIFFVDRISEEKKALMSFLDFMKEKEVTTLIGYNIKNFDIPYLYGKLFIHGINPKAIENYTLIDLYELVKRMRLKKKSLVEISEIAFDKKSEKVKSRFIPLLYMKYLDSRDEIHKDKIINHLKEDLINTRLLAKRLGII